jgi:hypothetical protein
VKPNHSSIAKTRELPSTRESTQLQRLNRHALIFARRAAARGVDADSLALGFELTHRCTSRHIVIVTRQLNGEPRSDPDCARGAGRLGTRRVSPDGGEPLTHPNVDEIVEFLVRRDVEVFKNTNGILVPRRIHTVRRLGKVKISLDGPQPAHDRMRGAGSFDKALRGAEMARAAGVDVELTCVVGSHNAGAIDDLLDLVQERGFRIVFQPARPSLFLESDRDGSAFMAEARELAAASPDRGAQALEPGRRNRNHPADTDSPRRLINATLDPRQTAPLRQVNRRLLEQRGAVGARGVERLTRQAAASAGARAWWRKIGPGVSPIALPPRSGSACSRA